MTLGPVKVKWNHLVTNELSVQLDHIALKK